MRLKGVLITLLLLSSANALSISVNGNPTQLSGEANLTIDYLIDLDNEALTDYSILLYNDLYEFQVFNESRIMDNTTGIIDYNVSHVASGDYKLALKLTQPLTYTVISQENITIMQDFNLRAEPPSTIYVKDNETIIEVLLINEGNTDLSISTYFRNARSDVSVNPQSFPLSRESNKTITITVAKPTSNYNTTLIIQSSNGEDMTNEYPISVIIPIINLIIQDVNILESTNETIINLQVNNTGNMDVNASVGIRTFSLLEGLTTQEEEALFNAGVITNYTKNIPKKDVVSVSLTYTIDNENITLTHELSPLNTLPFNFKLSTERLLLLGALIIVIIVIIYFKYIRRRRP